MTWSRGNSFHTCGEKMPKCVRASAALSGPEWPARTCSTPVRNRAVERQVFGSVGPDRRGCRSGVATLFRENGRYSGGDKSDDRSLVASNDDDVAVAVEHRVQPRKCGPIRPHEAGETRA